MVDLRAVPRHGRRLNRLTVRVSATKANPAFGMRRMAAAVRLALVKVAKMQGWQAVGLPSSQMDEPSRLCGGDIRRCK